jgi:hypothetical protein
MPIFYINNSQWTPSKPSVTIHSVSRTGPVLGVLNLLWSRDNVFAVGDPDASLGSTSEGEGDGVKSLNWENMRRTSKWTHATYEFEYRIEGGERKKYVWQRTRQMIFADQPDLELREKVKDGGEGRVLAAYKGCQGLVSKVRVFQFSNRF